MANEQNINLGSMLKKGTILHGTFRIDNYLSSGGFGNTYVATHTILEAKRAIKEFFLKGVNLRDSDSSQVTVSTGSDLAEFNQQLEKFKKEARRLYQLDNKNIVKVHDFFEENGTAYYVMDFIDGEDLKRKLERLNRPLDENEVRGILEQVLNALKAVHSHGIWHLDIKPANIIVGSDSTAKLIDFGASKQINAQHGGFTSSAVAYTNGYAPIEQMDKSFEKFGPWTDFYALGATLYNLLTNHRPPTPSDINDDHSTDKHLALPLPANVSNQMRDLILWLMKTDRFERPQSVDEILNYLNQQITTGGVPPVSREETRPHKEHEEASTQKPQEDQRGVKIAINPSKKENSNSKRNRILVSLLCAGIVIVGLFSLYNKYYLPKDSKPIIAGATKQEKSHVSNVHMTIPMGACTYTGEVNSQNLPDGKGTARFDKGDVCEGTFVNGIITGENIKYTVSNGDVFYGVMKNNKFSKGRYTIKEDGSYFNGTFKGNEPASGQWYDKHGNPID